MRELKFRIWNGAEMVYDVTVGKFGVFYVNPTNNGLDPKDSASITPFTTKYHEATPLMQFTGLLDKNGKEIYEGDIVRADNWNPKVFQTEKIIAPVGFTLGYFNLQTKAGLHLLYDTSGIEVIGNIYENAELLKDTV